MILKLNSKQSAKVRRLQAGKLVKQGTPQQLITELKGKVAELLCKPEELPELRLKYKIGNVSQRSSNLCLRLIGDHFPKEARRLNEEITLEDVYLYHLEI